VRADALRSNLATVRASVGPAARLVPMVKADAYGLGMANAVRALELEHPWGYGVAAVDEGVALRALGIERPVVVFTPTPPGSVETAIGADLQITVSSVAALEHVAATAMRLGRRAHVHVEVDTGMGRAGFDWREAATWMPRVEATQGPSLQWVGCYTHLHSADENAESVREQWSRLQNVLGVLEQSPEGLMVHILNSPGAMRTPEYAAGAVRPGIFIYGGRVGAGQGVPSPVASVHARVVHVRDAEPGTSVGYGSTYRAEGPERWATLAIGYGDGLPRALGNRGAALIGGVRVPIVGRISMDLTVVNTCGAPGVEVGDVGTLLGIDGDEEITVDDVAELAGTISYEVLTGLTARLPRIWTGLDGI